MNDLISRLSEIRSKYNCFDEAEGPYYRALSEAIKKLSERTYEDIISRQEVIKELEELNAISFYELNEHSREAYREIKQMLKELPPAQSEQRWIPVSERLPEPEKEYVLISKKPTKISGSKWSVDIAIRTLDPRSGKIQWRDSGFGVIQDDKVLAWMPLPEPYKEGEDE